MKRHYNAVAIQSACNITAVANALVEAIAEVHHEHGGILKSPTDAICNDAAVRLIVEQLAWLTKGRDYISASNECEALAQDRPDLRVKEK